MAGIYVHIPFCKSRCVYCGFFSTTHLLLSQHYVDALCKEMQMRRDYLRGESVATVYLGGGTPSLLTLAQFHQLFDAFSENFPSFNPEEVTLECNPEDITPQFAKDLSKLPVNRVSLGVQTFSDQRLRFLNRRHSAIQVHRAFDMLRQAGIANLSIDLIYGFPEETLQQWHHDVQEAVALGAEHMSAYALTYEEGTPLYQQLHQGRIAEVDEELSRQMYFDFLDITTKAGYLHYEISNFALPGFQSRHNSGYWNETPYLGLGAAAHSFDGNSRQWNVSNVERYIDGIAHGLPDFEREVLSATDRYNERVMTRLRTSEGLWLDSLSASEQQYCLAQADSYIPDGLLKVVDNSLLLTRRGIFVSDMIISDLMMA